jgi:uncharacterized protein YkwD
VKKHILISSLGVLLIIVTVITFAIVRGASVSTKRPYPSPLAKATPSPCLPVKQGICQGYLLVKSKEPGTVTLPPTPAPTPTPTQPPPTKSGAANMGYGTSLEKQLALQLFDQINIDRAALGLPSYAWNDTLASVAYQHNIVMATTGCGLMHQCPNEPTPCERFKNGGITLPACAENVDYTYISAYPDAWTAIKMHTEQGMLAEQPPNNGHRKNLLSTSLYQIGISVLIDSQGRAWVTEDMTGTWPWTGLN